MVNSLSRILVVAAGVWLMLLAGGNALAGSNIEVFVDLDGDGFDDNESDVNKDGVPDLVVPVEQPKVLASVGDLFSAPAAAPPPVKKTNAQHFALRAFSTRALSVSRAGASTGFEDIGSTAALGAEACPGGNCGI